MLRKSMSVLFLTALLLALVPGVALAQGPDVFCGSLSEADCALVTQSQQAMQELTSSAFNLSADFSMTSSKEFEPGINAIEINLTGSGALAADMSALADLQGMTPDQMAQMMDTLPQMLVDTLRGVAGQATFNLVLPPALMEGAPIPSELTLNLVGVDGVLYVDLRSLLPAESVEQEGTPAWIGIDVAGMYETLFQQMSDVPLSEMQGLLDASGFAQMMNPDLIGQFVSIERGADQTVDGQTVAVFTTTIDYQALASSDAFQQMMDQYMQAAMEMEGQSMEDLPIDMNALVSAMMSGIQLSVEEWVGLDDSLLHHVGMDMSFTLDREAIAAVAGNQASLSDVPDFGMTFNATLDLSDFNAPVEVTAPEGAQVINPMMMLPDMMVTPSGQPG